MLKALGFLLGLASLPLVLFPKSIDEGANECGIFCDLKKIFEASPPPTLEEISGWHTGRCYDKVAPNTPIGGLLVFEWEEVSDNGPLFGKVNELRLIGLRSPAHESENWFDELDDDKVAAVDRSIDTYLHKFKPAEIREGSLVSLSEDDQSFDNTLVRKSGPYYITLYQGKAANEENGIHTFVACYHFKQVRPLEDLSDED